MDSPPQDVLLRLEAYIEQDAALREMLGQLHEPVCGNEYNESVLYAVS